MDKSNLATAFVKALTPGPQPESVMQMAALPPLSAPFFDSIPRISKHSNQRSDAFYKNRVAKRRTANKVARMQRKVNAYNR